MNKLVTLAAASLTGLMLVGAAVPASAQSVGFSFGFGNHNGYSDYCDRHWRYRDCGYYRDRDDHVGVYNRHPLGASFGFVITDPDVDDDYRRPAYRTNNSHIDRCEARYRSYDARTDTFLGYDGELHYCNL